MKTHILKILFIFGLVFMAGSIEASSCNFSRNLGYGSRGSDVSCLQQYLTSTGAGYLTPDGVFGNRTSQVLMVWQAQNGIPTTGYFDAQSMTRYDGMGFSGGQVLGASTDYPSYLNTSTSQEMKAKQKIQDALEKIEDAEDEIEDSNENTFSAENFLESAKEDIFDAIREFFISRDYNDAEDYADDAIDNAEDAIDEAEGDGDEDSADDAIENAKDAIDDAEDAIEEADDDGQYVGDAEDLLDEAQDLLDEAEDEFDDSDYDHAEDLAEEAEDLANEAIDLL